MNGRGTRVCTGARGGGAAKPKQSMVHDMVDWFAWSGRASIVHTRCVSGAGRTVESGHHQLSVSETLSGLWSGVSKRKSGERKFGG